MDIRKSIQILKAAGYTVKKRVNENAMSEYLMDRVYDVANDIYIREINDHAPSLDRTTNRPDYEYLQRFDYLSDDLKNAIKRAANALQKELQSQGIDIHIKNLETEIYDALKLYSKV